VTQCTAPALSLSVNANNQITNSGFAYDASGDMTSDGTYTYTWDARHRLQSANGVTYTYDGDGKRVMKSSGTLYWNLADGTPLAETNASGSTLNEYIFFNGNRVARRDSSGNVYYYLLDHLGTTKTNTTSAGVVCYDADFLPYGQEMAYVTTCSQNYKFTGLERDTETGLDHTLNRMYDSNLGRWLAPDRHRGNPFNPQSWNRYAYVLDNPVNFSDPYGLVNWWQAGEIALGLLEMGTGFATAFAIAAAEAPTLGTASIGGIAAAGLIAGGAATIMAGVTNSHEAAEAASWVGVVSNPAGFVFAVGSAIVGQSTETSLANGEAASLVFDVYSSYSDIGNLLNNSLNAQAGSDVLDVMAAMGNATLTGTELLSALVNASSGTSQPCNADICTGISSSEVPSIDPSGNPGESASSTGEGNASENAGGGDGGGGAGDACNDDDTGCGEC